MATKGGVVSKPGVPATVIAEIVALSGQDLACETSFEERRVEWGMRSYADEEMNSNDRQSANRHQSLRYRRLARIPQYLRQVSSPLSFSPSSPY